jgi:hypothetical protein
MTEIHRPTTSTAEPDDFAVARMYANGSVGSRHIDNWIGTPESAHPASPDDLPQAAADTMQYFLSRPAAPQASGRGDSHYDATLRFMPKLDEQNARALVELWVGAEIANDRTKVQDIQDELLWRALPGDYERSESTVEPAERAAYIFNSLYDRKERLKRQRQALGSAIPGVDDAVPAPLSPIPAPSQRRATYEGIPLRPVDEHASLKPVRAPVPVPTEREFQATPPVPGLADELLREREEVTRPEKSHGWVALREKYRSYLYDPNQGRRRRIIGIAALAGLGALLCGLCVVGVSEIDRDNGQVVVGSPTTARPSVYPTPSVTVAPSPTIAPSIEPSIPGPVEPIVPAVGHNYVWGAFASVYGQEYASQEILERVTALREHGWDIDVWGDPPDGQWGISCMTTPRGRQINSIPGQIEALNYADTLENGTMSTDPASFSGPAQSPVLQPEAVQDQLPSRAVSSFGMGLRANVSYAQAALHAMLLSVVPYFRWRRKNKTENV